MRAEVVLGGLAAPEGEESAVPAVSRMHWAQGRKAEHTCQPAARKWMHAVHALPHDFARLHSRACRPQAWLTTSYRSIFLGPTSALARDEVQVNNNK